MQTIPLTETEILFCDLALKLLDNDEGITVEAYEALRTFSEHLGLKDFDFLVGNVMEMTGREDAVVEDFIPTEPIKPTSYPRVRQDDGED